MPLGIDERARKLFNAAVRFNLGNGQRISFWHDPWTASRCSLAAIAPDLFKFCTKRNLTVAQAITDDKWIRHFKQNLTTAALRQFLQVCDILTDVQLLNGTDDTISWLWTTNGNYTASSAYEMQFEGSTRFSFRDTVWTSGVPLKCRIFSWLAIRGKCHTADCLQKKGWPHNAACVFCLSEPETAVHLLASCPVIIRLWHKIIHTAALPNYLVPPTNTHSLEDWLMHSRQRLPNSLKKNWTAVVHLAWWSIWKERNARIFNNKAEPLSRILSAILEEARCWRDAGKPSAADLLLRPREPD